MLCSHALRPLSLRHKRDRGGGKKTHRSNSSRVGVASPFPHSPNEIELRRILAGNTDSDSVPYPIWLATRGETDLGFGLGSNLLLESLKEFDLLRVVLGLLGLPRFRNNHLQPTMDTPAWWRALVVEKCADLSVGKSPPHVIERGERIDEVVERRVVGGHASFIVGAVRRTIPCTGTVRMRCQRSVITHLRSRVARESRLRFCGPRKRSCSQSGMTHFVFMRSRIVSRTALKLFSLGLRRRIMLKVW